MAKILFLEDEKMIREVISEYLKLAGYEVCECEDGDRAVELIDEKDFDIAILDIKVPGRSGISVLEYIRSSDNSNMGVIMLTAFEDENTQLEAFNNLADDYVIKPTSPIILLKRIEVLLRRVNSKKIEGAQDLIIDEEGYRIIYKSEDLNLTVTEFLIFKIFKDNPKRVFTREQLIEQVYEGDYYGSDRVIDAHIKNIRKKMPYNLIETVIGLGYRWKDYNDETKK